MTIAVLGAGMVGRAIALDLAKDYSVTSFDLNAKKISTELLERSTDLYKQSPLIFLIFKNTKTCFRLLIL